MTQILKTLTGDKGLPQTCLIGYQIENQDDRPHTVGLRAMIDTKIGANDAPVFALPGQDKLTTTWADWKDQEVPVSLRVLEKSDLKDPGLSPYLTLRPGGNLEPAARLLVTRFPGDKEALSWEVPGADFAGNSAVFLYWQPQELKPGEKRVVGFAYGLQVADLKKATIPITPAPVPPAPVPPVQPERESRRTLGHSRSTSGNSQRWT